MFTSERIKTVRNEAGLTQEQLANALGVKRAVISKYETGKISPTIDQLQKIAAACNSPFEAFLGRSPLSAKDINYVQQAAKNAPKAESVEQENMARMNRAMGALNMEGQQEAIKRVEEMADLSKYKKASFMQVWGYDKPNKPE